METYYQDEWVTQYCSDALRVLSGLAGESIDLLATDPPYGISFMGKDWDRALPDIEVWRECLRVLKAGSFAFVMSIPRADCLSRMIISLENAGFWVNFTPIFWTYASGFPKAQNIGKAVDKRLEATREVVGKNPNWRPSQADYSWGDGIKTAQIINPNLTEPSTPQAKALDGSYGGFQPKPAVEVIIVAMKPLSEKTFVDQALKNQKGITWLDDCRIPYESEGDKDGIIGGISENIFSNKPYEGDILRANPTGRFPANLLVSDDVLNDGVSHTSGRLLTHHKRNANSLQGTNTFKIRERTGEFANWGGDSGSFSRYFDLDKWWAKTFPFLIVPKASKKEKGKNNNHPTVKPLKLMSYLIMMGSREGDTVIDPFLGSGTTALASKLLNRHCIGIEIEEKYCEIAASRCRRMVMDLTKGYY